jgi:hypothetical protein
MAEPVPGDPEVMLQCLIEEFAWMGSTTEDLLALFRSPGYPVLNQLLAHFGADEVRRRIEERMEEYPALRFTEVIADEPKSDEPELIQLSLEKINRSRLA